MLARCTTYALDGITAHRVTVECDVRPGLPSFTVLGLGDASVRELRDTVHAAIQNSGYPFPERRVTLNLAPSWLRCRSGSLPLAAALAVLAASGEIPAEHVADLAVYGALRLGGEVAPLPGTLAAAAAHRTSGCAGPLLYAGPALAQDLAPAGALVVEHLADIPSVPACSGTTTAQPPEPARGAWPMDFSDLRGHQDAIFALTVAAAGGHHVLLRGAPGSGATMLARRLVTILPELTADQEREVATIRDAAGLGHHRARPFRAPHRTISPAGLVGGGSPVHPGEITLAHRGILFLSDLPDFSRPALEALRAPLDEESVVIVRGERASRFPSTVQLVATALPCPCGHDGTSLCVCDSQALARHHRRLSASLLDRFSIVVDLPAAVDTDAPTAPSSATLRDRVCAARDRRAVARAAPPSTVGGLQPPLTDAAWVAFHDALRAGSLGHRSGARVCAVAQTVALLAGEDVVTADSFATALALGGRLVGQTSKLVC
jgi:magnesium chelatase family protein